MSDGEESDQLPEEGPSEQVHDDDGGADRDESAENEGGADDDAQSTGNSPQQD